MFTKKFQLIRVFTAFAIALVVPTAVMPAQAGTMQAPIIDSPGALDITFDGDGLVTTQVGAITRTDRQLPFRWMGK